MSKTRTLAGTSVLLNYTDRRGLFQLPKVCPELVSILTRVDRAPIRMSMADHPQQTHYTFA